MQRRTRLLVAALLAVTGGAIALVGTAPEAVATVSDAVAKAPGSTVDVRGAVKAGTVAANGTEATFVLTDGARDLEVRWSRPLPEHEAGGALDGRTVLVTGVVRTDARGPYLEATDLKVGCASKYETA